MPYPDGAVLRAFLVGAKLEVPNDADLDPFASEAAQAWEDDTDWHPFLAQVRTETVDGPGGYSLYPSFGIVSLTSLAVDGNELTLGTDCRLTLPRRGGPFSEIRFGKWVSEDAVITMTGSIGYAESLDPRVIQAILRRGAILFSASVHGPQGSLVREKYADVEYQYAGGSRESGTQVAQWQTAYDTDVAAYRRWGVG